MESLTKRYDSPMVKRLMNKYNRYHFVINKKDAYIDRPSMLMEDQTISAPHMHAKAIEYMEPILTPGNHILDIGSGSGYLCAVFGEAVGIKNHNKNIRGKVVGIEVIQSLVDYSIKVISNHYPELLKNRGHLKIIKGDGKDGYPIKSVKMEYDGIHIGAAWDYIPFHLLRQLKKGGIMVLPLKMGSDRLQFCVINKDIEGNIHIHDKGSVRYVPLI